jgi:hypothetical protein
MKCISKIWVCEPSNHKEHPDKSLVLKAAKTYDSSTTCGGACGLLGRELATMTRKYALVYACHIAVRQQRATGKTRGR